jgi:hypothetical protein
VNPRSRHSSALFSCALTPSLTHSLTPSLFTIPHSPFSRLPHSLTPSLMDPMHAPSAHIWHSAGPVSLPLEQVQAQAQDYVTKTTPLERRFSPYDFNGG